MQDLWWSRGELKGFKQDFKDSRLHSVPPVPAPALPHASSPVLPHASPSVVSCSTRAEMALVKAVSTKVARVLFSSLPIFEELSNMSGV